MIKLNLDGKRFGRLLILKRCETREPLKSFKWLCQCDCGIICEKSGTLLVRGQTKSCGCLKTGFNRKSIKRNKGKLELLIKIGDIYTCECFSCNSTVQVTKSYFYKYDCCEKCRKKSDKRVDKSNAKLEGVPVPKSGKIKEILDLRNTGKTWQQIGDHFGISKQAIQDKINKYINTFKV